MYDIHSPNVPSVEWIEALLEKAAAAKEADGVDNLLGDLSSGKNAPKTGGGAKGNNASAAGSGNTKTVPQGLISTTMPDR